MFTICVPPACQELKRETGPKEHAKRLNAQVTARVHSRSLIVFTSGKHDDVSRRGLGGQRPIISVVSSSGLLEEAHDVVGNATEITLAIGRDDAQKTLTSFLGKVGLLEDTLGRVDVR